MKHYQRQLGKPGLALCLQGRKQFGCHEKGLSDLPVDRFGAASSVM
jgi:hypothetical protein